MSTRTINLGAATEQRITDAFAKRALISTAQAAALLGLDRRVVQRLAVAGELGSTVEGADSAGKERRLFSERHVRTFLEGRSDWAFTGQSGEDKKPRTSTSISRSEAKGFMDRPDKHRSATPKPTSARSARK